MITEICNINGVKSCENIGRALQLNNHVNSLSLFYTHTKGILIMSENERRSVRMGIDVGGTYTKCVAMDNLTHEIIGKNEVKTTHDDKDGVAAGVVQSFRNCMAENGIKPEDVVFVAHSTTQATNAFIEGDVANVGVFGVAGGWFESFLAKRHPKLRKLLKSSMPLHERKT